MNKSLHIVSFDIPLPANYGGVIDVFYKIKSLYEAGIEIHLHCFIYGERTPQIELANYCKEVHYYQRKKRYNLFSKIPYIVSTRSSDKLLSNLVNLNAPILFEGLHCCAYLDHPKLQNRKKLVRMHNVEHDYYSKLYNSERIFWKKYYFKTESDKLKYFEEKLTFSSLILAISPKDEIYLKKLSLQTIYLPAFHGNNGISSKKGQGNYCLYHGKLNVNENNEAALFLVNNIFNQIPIKLIIAGNGASKELRNAIKGKENILLVDNVSQSQMDEYIQNAQINVIPTFQATGIKLKLINVLFKGRFVLTNSTMVDQTGLESLCAVKETSKEWISSILDLMNHTFDQNEIEKRSKILTEKFNNTHNINSLLNTI